MNSEQVKSFAEANKVAIAEENKISRCVDGRYEGIKNFPMVAKPGGDAGDIMAAFGAINELGLELDGEMIINAVMEAVGGKEKFAFHTDSHAEHDNAGCGMGCGHLKKAKLEPDEYGLKQEQMDFLFNKLPQFLEEGAHQEILNGDHAETAVLVVDSENFGLKPLLHSEDGIQEAFVYHKTLHQEQLDQLAKELQEKLAETGVVREEVELRKALDTAFGKQLNATLQRLAKDLPVYTVKISETGEVEVE